jgi:hypothetical protein
MAAVWVFAQCILVKIDRRFKRSIIFLMVEEVGTANTSVSFYHITRRNILEDSHIIFWTH